MKVEKDIFAIKICWNIYDEYNVLFNVRDKTHKLLIYCLILINEWYTKIYWMVMWVKNHLLSLSYLLIDIIENSVLMSKKMCQKNLL